MKMHLKSKSKKKKTKIFILLLITILIILIINKLAGKISQILLIYAEQETKQIISNVINKSLTLDTFDRFNQKELYNIEKNKNNEIEMIDYNSITVNLFLDEITNIVEKDLKTIEEETIYLPLGVVTDNILLQNIGPKIPIKIKRIGYISTNIKTDLKEYGVNSSIIYTSLEIEINMKILLPIVSKDIIIQNEIPISYRIMNNNISNYYSTYGITKSSNVFKNMLE